MRFDLHYPERTTPHFYGRPARTEFEDWFERLPCRGPGFFISSEPVLAALGRGVFERLEPSRPLELVTVPDGESCKRLTVVERLCERLVAQGAERGSLLVAFGGGSVGDLVGFTAAVLLRGVSWIACPTTLLAQVDAAVGGKTGVDLASAKNSIGAFHPPLAVFADPEWLSTLPEAELRGGIVEAVKTAAVADGDLFEAIERRFDRLRAGSLEDLAWLAAEAARAKARLVEKDPRDSGLRALLNLGHTLGHALEVTSNYSLRHGDAVALGIRFATRLAVSRGADRGYLGRLLGLLDRLSIEKPPLPEAGVLIATMRRDKKVRSGRIGWVLPLRPGEAAFGVEIAAAEVEAELAEFLAEGILGPNL